MNNHVKNPYALLETIPKNLCTYLMLSLYEISVKKI